MTLPPLCECGIRHPQIPSTDLPDSVADPYDPPDPRIIETVKITEGRL